VSARTEADLETEPSRRRYKRSSEGGSWGADDLNAYDMALFPSTSVDYWRVETYGPPEVHGSLLFDGGLIPQRHAQATLSAWCAIFVGDAHVSLTKLGPVEWGRYKTCLAGSFDWSAVMVWLSLVEPMDTRRRWCPQLLTVSFLSEAQRRESYGICNSASRQPTGQYTNWGQGIPDLV